MLIVEATQAFLWHKIKKAFEQWYQASFVAPLIRNWGSFIDFFSLSPMPWTLSSESDTGEPSQPLPKIDQRLNF